MKFSLVYDVKRLGITLAKRDFDTLLFQEKQKRKNQTEVTEIFSFSSQISFGPTKRDWEFTDYTLLCETEGQGRTSTDEVEQHVFFITKVISSVSGNEK